MIFISTCIVDISTRNGVIYDIWKTYSVGVDSLRRVVIVSTGFTIKMPIEAILRTGLGEGDAIIIVNSEPFKDRAVEVVEKLEEFIRSLVQNIEIIRIILDPRDGFAENVRRLRRLIESYSPCKTYFLAVGGFRWLSILLFLTAHAIYTRKPLHNVYVEKLILLLEESPLVLKHYPILEERIIEVPVKTRLADVDNIHLYILEAIANKYQRTKQIKRYLELKGIKLSTKTITKKIGQLIRKELLEYEKRGRTFIYKLTTIAKTIA